jgi:uncharacterized protein YgiM (DUF1202 family)
MSQYDAGPGEWSDRPWEDPNKKPTPQAHRRRVTLPPWALLVGLVGIVIILCVGLVLIIRAATHRTEAEVPTAEATITTKAAETIPTATMRAIMPTLAITPTSTVTLPLGSVETPVPFTEIAPGATVVVSGAGTLGLNLREQPTTYAKIVTNAKEGTVLTVLAGPKESDGYTWWQVRAPDGKEGWGAANWMALKSQ